MCAHFENTTLLVCRADDAMDWAGSLEERLAAMEALEAKEDEIVEEAIEQVEQEFPDASNNYQGFYDKSDRVLKLVLRYCALAMVREDVRFLEERLLNWMKNILQSFFSRERIRQEYGSGPLDMSVETSSDQPRIVIRPRE